MSRTLRNVTVKFANKFPLCSRKENIWSGTRVVNERNDHRDDGCTLGNNSYLHEYVASDMTEALDHQIELAARIANRIKSLSATLHTLALSD